MNKELITDSVFEIRGLLDNILNALDETPAPEPDPDPNPQPIPRKRNVGINLTRPTYWDNCIIYSDVLKQAGFVTGYGKTDEQDIPVDSNGRPTVDTPYNNLKLGGVAGVNAHLPISKNGLYKLILEGETQIRFPRFIKTSEDSLINFQEVEKSNFLIENSKVGSNWKLFYPEESTNSLFHSYFLKSLQGFSCIRGMDWTSTNGSLHVDWADRRLPTDMGQSSDYGACWEHLIELANELKCNLWICIPHQATDNYIRYLAALMNDVHPDCHLFVEYSNECWNAGAAFKNQFNYCMEAGASEFPSETNYFSRGAKGYGFLANKAYKIFDSEFRGDANYVCAWQAAANYSHRDAIEQCDFADYLSLAPYISVDNWQSDKSLDVTIDRIYNEGLARSRDYIEKYNNLAYEYSLTLCCYECGLHTVGGPDFHKSYDLSRRPEMEDIIIKYDDIWDEVAGDELRCYYNYCGKARSGNPFGHQEYSGDDHPKWRGLRRLID